MQKLENILWYIVTRIDKLLKVALWSSKTQYEQQQLQQHWITSPSC